MAELLTLSELATTPQPLLSGITSLKMWALDEKERKRKKKQLLRPSKRLYFDLSPKYVYRNSNALILFHVCILYLISISKNDRFSVAMGKALFIILSTYKSTEFLAIIDSISLVHGFLNVFHTLRKQTKSFRFVRNR